MQTFSKGRMPKNKASGVFGDLTNDGYSQTNVLDPTPTGDLGVILQDTTVSRRRKSFRPRHSTRPPAAGAKPPSSQRPRKPDTFVPLQHRKKLKHNSSFGPLPSLALPEDCIGRLPPGVPFPKKPSGCEVIPQTIEPRTEDRSTVYFTRNGVLGIPLQYMYNLDDMDYGDEPVNLGLDPTKTLCITLVIAWPGYKEATYDVAVRIPLHPSAPFVTIYGLRQLTKRELAVETLRCVHRWMIEHPWSGERYEGIPEWELTGGESPGASAKLVWLTMIVPVGDGRWVTQLQKAPGR